MKKARDCTACCSVPKRQSRSKQTKKCECLHKSQTKNSDRSSSRNVQKTNQYYSQTSTVPQQILPNRMNLYEQSLQIDASPITNLNLKGCEFPITARNHPTQNFFQTVDLPKDQLFMVQQPFQTIQHFNSNRGYYSPIQDFQTQQSPFRKQVYEQPQIRSFSPAQRDKDEIMMTPTKRIFQHYEKVMQQVELYQRERMLSLREGLNKLVESLKIDEVITAMREDPLSQHYAFQRMKEVIDNALVVESEQLIANLKSENTILREKILILEADVGQKLTVDKEKIDKKVKKLRYRKDLYKSQLQQSQEQIQQLIQKFKDVEQEIQKTQSEYEIKLASKDGELARCEKALSEIRAMLSEKTLAQNRLENNLSNEVTVLSDRIVNLEREKNEIIEKYTKYGDEFKSILEQEQDTYSAKIQRLKDIIKGMKQKLQEGEQQKKEVESQMNIYQREIDQQRVKIETLAKENSEKSHKLIEIQHQTSLQSQALTQTHKEKKQNYKQALAQLQLSYEQTFKEKSLELEQDYSLRIASLENEKKEIDLKYKNIQCSVENQQEEMKEQLQKQMRENDKKVQKLQTKFEKEMVCKLNEVEEKYRNQEEEMRKQFKKEKKMMVKLQEDEKLKNEEEKQIMQEQMEQQYREMSFKLREEIDKHQKQSQEQKIKIAELTVIIDAQKSEIERLQRENDQILMNQKDLTVSHKEELKVLEKKLQTQQCETDGKLKQALDSAIKSQNLELIAQQYAQELDKKQQENEYLKEALQRQTCKQEKLQEELKSSEQEKSSIKQKLYEQEMSAVKSRSHMKEAINKVLSCCKLQINKYRQEIQFFKKQMTQELQMNQKHIESLMHNIISKARENNMSARFKLEKLQYVYEQRFQKEFSAREVEWEKILDKKDEQINQKERQLRELENQKLLAIRQENEIQQLKSQIQQSIKDYHTQLEDLKSKLHISEQKSSDLTHALKRQEDQLLNQNKLQIQDLKMQLQQQKKDETLKIEAQIDEFRSKSKQKISDLSLHIQEIQNKHRQDIVQMRNLYEEKLKQLQDDNDNKQKIIFEGQNQLNILSFKFETFGKDNESLENQLKDAQDNLKKLSEQYQQLKTTFDLTINDKLLMEQQVKDVEDMINQLKNSNQSLQSQLYVAEKKLKNYTKDLKEKTKKLNLSKKKEQQEIQFLNDVLTKAASSSRKSSRKSLLISPDFKEIRRNDGLYTARAYTNQENTGDYKSILSEINSMIDSQGLRHSQSNQKKILRETSQQRFNNIANSPSVNQLNPSVSFYPKKGILKSPSSYESRNENSTMRISDLRCQ